MKPGIIYRITQEPFYKYGETQKLLYVDIMDTDNLINDSDDPQVIYVIPGGEPFELEVIDTDEDPFSVIKSLRSHIRIDTDNGIDLATFASGSDQRWQVHAYLDNDTNTVFKGFVSIADMSMDFMPDPNELNMMAVDGLNMLSDIPLVDFQDLNPSGEYTLGEYLAMCLRKSGHSLEMMIAFNIKPAGFIDDISIPNVNDQHLFNLIYLNAKSFEDDINTCINCKEVIERILGEEAVIFQRQGAWWIMRIDEIEHPTRGLYITRFDENGKFIENLGEIHFDKQTGKDAPYTIFFSQEQTNTVIDRPHKSVKLSYNYETPKEVIENIDFERGELINTIALVVSPTQPYTTERWYKTDGWTMRHGEPGSYSAPTVNSYTKRLFNAGEYEKERFIVIPFGSSFSTREYLESTRIKLSAGDKFNFSADWRILNNIDFGIGFDSFFAVMVFHGDDGKWYKLGFGGVAGQGTYGDDNPRWLDTVNFTVNQLAGYLNFDSTNNNETEWINQSWEAPPVGVAGDLFIRLYPFGNPSHNYETLWANLNFEYLPLINGSYQKYSSQYQFVSQTGGYKAKRDNQIYLTDGLKKIFKGAMVLPLLYQSFFTGSVQFFAASSTIQISGYHLGDFRRGQRISISGSTSNNISARVLSVSYSTIGTLTVIEVDKALVNETASVTISELTFELATRFYNAAVFPAGPPSSDYIHPYSEIQVFDVWNQFKNGSVMLQADLQGLHLDQVDGNGFPDIAHMIHKWTHSDPTYFTINRFFFLMTFRQSFRTCGWSGLYRQSFDTTVAKSYLGREFKYVVG